MRRRSKRLFHACAAAKWAAAATSTMTTFRAAWRGNSLCAALFRRVPERTLSDCPDDLERRLPPPDCEHGFGRWTCEPVNRRPFLVGGVFPFEVY
jgi:hypothetical protein